jgi:hypothetical protein
MRIHERQRLIDEQVLVRLQSEPQYLAGQCVSVVLANSRKIRSFAKQFFEAPFVLDQLVEVLLRTELPCHIACRPKTFVAITYGLLDAEFESPDHLIDVEGAFRQMILIGREHETAPVDFMADIGSGCGHVTFHSSHHRGAVQINAAVSLFQFLPRHLGNRAQHEGRRAFVDKTLVARYGSHNLEGIIAIQTARDNQVIAGNRVT